MCEHPLCYQDTDLKSNSKIKHRKQIIKKWKRDSYYSSNHLVQGEEVDFKKSSLPVPCVSFRLSIIQDCDGFPGHQNNDCYITHATCQTILQYCGLR